MSEPTGRRARSALGGGHGLAASLSALRHVVDDLTAVVTVADNGGSSGRLREEFDCLPPGDLRQALAALCDDDDWGATWARVLQHRFTSDGSDGQARRRATCSSSRCGSCSATTSPVSTGWASCSAPRAGCCRWPWPRSTSPRPSSGPIPSAPTGPSPWSAARSRSRPPRAGCARSRLDPTDPPGVPAGRGRGQERRLGRPRARARGSPASSRTCSCPSCATALEQTTARTLVVLNLEAQAGETEGFTPRDAPRGARGPRPRSGRRRRARRPRPRAPTRRLSSRSQAGGGRVWCWPMSPVRTELPDTTWRSWPAPMRTSCGSRRVAAPPRRRTPMPRPLSSSLDTGRRRTGPERRG